MKPGLHWREARAVTTAPLVFLNCLIVCFFQLDRDGLHDLNVQGDWQKKNGTYWVRYVHVELLGHDSFGKSIKLDRLISHGKIRLVVYHSLLLIHWILDFL